MKNIINDHNHTATSLTPSQFQIQTFPPHRLFHEAAHRRSLSLTPCFSKVWAAPPGPSTVSTVSYSDSNFVSIRAIRVSTTAKPPAECRSSFPQIKIQNSKIKNQKSKIENSRKPTGKIAKLPKAQRDLINQMLDDGATYKSIEIEMAKHGVSLNGENISNWFDSGFQLYPQHQDRIAETRLLRENASDLVQDYNVIQFHQAANQLAIGQIFKSLTQQQLTEDPINFVRTLNALARLSRAALVLKQCEDASAKALAETKKPETQADLDTKIENKNQFSALAFRCSPGRHENRSQFICFAKQLLQASYRHQSAFNQQLHPKHRFIRFLFRYRKLVHKIRSRSGPTCSPVICCYRSTRTQQLIPKPSTNKILRQCACQLDHPQRKRLRPLLHLILSHNFGSVIFFATINIRALE